MSDWRIEIEQGIQSSKTFTLLKEKTSAKGDAVNSQVISLIYDCLEYAYEKSKMIIRYLPEYTLHDSKHLFRVLYLMEKLIPPDTFEQLSSPELMLLILSAFFHDLGMAPDEEDIKAWKCQWHGDKPTQMESEKFQKYELFKNTQPEKLNELERLISNQEYAKADLIEQHLISEFIRTTHTKRVKELIAKDWKGKIKYQETDLTKTLADICFSHNEDSLRLLELDPDFLCGEDEFVCIPFIGIILRIADLLDFDAKRTPTVLFSHLSVRNPISLSEWQKHRAIKAWRVTSDDISFSADCNHPAIEASIRKFCDYIDGELKNRSVIASKIAELTPVEKYSKYKFVLPLTVNRNKIGAEKDIATGLPLYEYWDTSFELNKNQVVELLMGTQLYANKEVALRELVQNSIDACLLSEALHKVWGVPYKPEIEIKYYKQNNDTYLEVNDNGIGMNKEIVNNYYSKIGASFYKSKTFYEMRATSSLDFKPISRFGIGILSAFMVSDSIEVETKHLKGQYDYDFPIRIIIEGYDSIFTILTSERSNPGTSTKLILKKDHPWRYSNSKDMIKNIRNAVPNPRVPIKITVDEEHEHFDITDFSKRKAIELKNYQWASEENVAEIIFDINEEGYIGNAIIGVIEKDGIPVESVDVHSNQVDVNGEKFDLSLEIEWATNEIEKKGDSIEIDDSGNIHSSSHSQTVAKSNALFSIQGIHYDGGLFPNYIYRPKKTTLLWPFPMLLILDINGENNLDLNSARNEIVYNEKWDMFEQTLARIICAKIQKDVSEDYSKALFKLFRAKSKSKNFLIGLNEVTPGKNEETIIEENQDEPF